MRTELDHEKLEVYQLSLDFIRWTMPVLDRVAKTLAAHNQLDRASTSTPLNIAEGNGKFTAPDRCRFFDIARGSALECGACLDVLVVKGAVSATDIVEGKARLVTIVSMLFGLIRTNSPTRVYEDGAEYAVGRGE